MCMKITFILLVLAALLGICGATEEDYQRGFADGFNAGLAACSANLTTDQYAEIMAALQEIRDKLDKKEQGQTGNRTTKVVSLVVPES